MIWYDSSQIKKSNTVLLYITLDLLEVKLPYDTVKRSVCPLVCQSVDPNYNFLKGRTVSFPCSYRSTCLVKSISSYISDLYKFEYSIGHYTFFYFNLYTLHLIQTVHLPHILFIFFLFISLSSLYLPIFLTSSPLSPPSLSFISSPFISINYSAAFYQIFIFIQPWGVAQRCG